MQNSNSSGSNGNHHLEAPPPPRISIESGRWTVDTDEVVLNADQEEFDLEVGAERIQLENQQQELSTSSASTNRHRKLGQDERSERQERNEGNEREERSERGERGEREEKDDSPGPSRRKRRISSSSESSNSSTSSSTSSSTTSSSDQPYFLDPKREKDRVKKLKRSRKRYHKENKAKRRSLLRNRSRERGSNSRDRRSTSREKRSSDRNRYRSPDSSNQRRERHHPSNHSHRTASDVQLTNPNPTQIIIVPMGNPYMQPTVPPHAIPFMAPHFRPRNPAPRFYGPMSMHMQPQMPMRGPMAPFTRPYMMPPHGRFPHAGYPVRRPIRPQYFKKKKQKKAKKAQQNQNQNPDSSNQ